MKKKVVCIKKKYANIVHNLNKDKNFLINSMSWKLKCKDNSKHHNTLWSEQ